MNHGQDVRRKLTAKKLSCSGNCCSAKSSSQCASDSRHSGHEHLFSKDDLVRTFVDDESLCTMGSRNAWLKNEGLSTRNIKWKFKVYAVELEFVCEAHRNWRWDGYTVTTLRLNSKACSGSIKHASSPSPRQFKVQASADKIVYAVFWDAEGVLLIDYMPHKVTVTWVY